MSENPFIPPRFLSPPDTPDSSADEPFVVNPLPPSGMTRQHLTEGNGSELYVQAQPEVVTATADAFLGKSSPSPNIPSGMEHEVVPPDADGRRLEVIAENSITSAVKQTFADAIDALNSPPSRTFQNYLAATPLGRRLIAFRTPQYTPGQMLAAGALGAMLAGGVVAGYALVEQNTYQPSPTRITLSPSECTTVSPNTIVFGQSMSIDGEEIGDVPNTGVVILFTAPHEICSTNTPLTVDVVDNDADIPKVMSADTTSLQTNGCDNGQACDQVITIRK